MYLQEIHYSQYNQNCPSWADILETAGVVPLGVHTCVWWVFVVFSFFFACHISQVTVWTVCDERDGESCLETFQRSLWGVAVGSEVSRINTSGTSRSFAKTPSGSREQRATDWAPDTTKASTLHHWSLAKAPACVMDEVRGWAIHRAHKKHSICPVNAVHTV